MKKYIKYIAIVLAILAIIIMIINAKDLAQPKLIKYAEKNYGKAECISYVEDEENSVTATLKDKQYSFVYTVKSTKEPMYIDGTYFGKYENKTSTFVNEYVKYIQNTELNKLTDIENNYNCKITWNDAYSTNLQDMNIIDIYLKEPTKCEEVLVEIAAIVEKIDTRKFFNKCEIYGYYNNEFIGKYKFENKKYINNEDSDINWALNSAMQIMNSYYNLKVKSIDDLKYIKYEIMDVYDIPGIANENLGYRITDTEDSLKSVKVYYYKFKNQDWLVADCIVKPGHLYVHKIDN